jgi:hypothetical protein
MPRPLTRAADAAVGAANAGQWSGGRVAARSSRPGFEDAPYAAAARNSLLTDDGER